jgi:hypothetical protein
MRGEAVEMNDQERVWVMRYRIHFDACDAFSTTRDYLEKHKIKNITEISEEKANLLNAEFKRKWPGVK